MKLISAIGTIIILMIIFVSIYFSPVSLHIAGAIAKSQTPGKLTYASLSGNLWNTIELHDVDYQYHGNDIKISDINLKFNALAYIKHRKIDVKTITIDGVTIDIKQHQPEQINKIIEHMIHEKSLKTKDKKNKPTEVPSIFDEIPIPTKIESGTIRNITINWRGNPKSLRIPIIHLGAIWQKNKVAIKINAIASQPIKTDFVLTAKGKPNDFTFQSIITSPDISHLVLSGRNTSKKIDLSIDSGKLLKGNIDSAITYFWTQPKKFNMYVILRKVQFNLINPHWPIVKEANIGIEKSIKDTSIRILKFKIELNHKEYHGSANANFVNPKNYHFAINLHQKKTFFLLMPRIKDH